MEEQNQDDGEMMEKHDHKWLAVETSLYPPLIGVECECGESGYVENYSVDEWNKAYNAPSTPYEWKGEVKQKPQRDLEQ